MGKEQILPIGTMIRLNSEPISRLDFLREAGMDCCQLCRVGEDFMHGDAGKAKTTALSESLCRNHLAMSSMFFFYPGMQWTDEECGITPEHHRTERLLFSLRQILWGKQFGAKYFVCHAGKFPKAGTPGGERWVADMRQFCRLAAEFNAWFLLETGPEPAAVFKTFLEALDEPNAGINFDPANLLIYNQTDPEVFLNELGGYVRAVHCKDARRPAVGETRGKETPLGQGDTRFSDRLKQLYVLGFRGPLVIEREIMPGPEQDKDILSAVKLLQSLRAELLA